jgi:hypothetical protein
MTQEYVDGLLATGGLPPVRGLEERIVSSAHPAWLEFQYDLVQQAPHYQLSWDQALPPPVSAALLEHLPQLFDGRLTPAELSAAYGRGSGGCALRQVRPEGARRRTTSQATPATAAAPAALSHSQALRPAGSGAARPAPGPRSGSATVRSASVSPAVTEATPPPTVRSTPLSISTHRRPVAAQAHLGALGQRGVLAGEPTPQAVVAEREAQPGIHGDPGSKKTSAPTSPLRLPSARGQAVRTAGTGSSSPVTSRSARSA